VISQTEQTGRRPGSRLRYAGARQGEGGKGGCVLSHASTGANQSVPSFNESRTRGRRGVPRFGGQLVSRVDALLGAVPLRISTHEQSEREWRAGTRTHAVPRGLVLKPG
jgi:hypothetical protein